MQWDVRVVHAGTRRPQANTPPAAASDAPSSGGASFSRRAEALTHRTEGCLQRDANALKGAARGRARNSEETRHTDE